MEYRIIRNNKYPINFRYYIQKRFLGLFWLNISDQAYNNYSLEDTKEKLATIIGNNRRYNLRKQTKNNMVM